MLLSLCARLLAVGVVLVVLAGCQGNKPDTSQPAKDNPNLPAPKGTTKNPTPAA